jgi:hypothetical protein
VIFGGCPYCDESYNTPYEASCLVEKIICTGCHKPFFVLHSQIMPEAFKEEELEIDPVNKIVKRKWLNGETV